MNEVKKPKKPLMYYYMVVMTIVVLFNLLAMPWIANKQVKEVSYGTFMSMTEEGNIGRVDIQTNQIVFTDKEETAIYKTGIVEDSDRAQRLYDAGITDFGSEIVEETSPLAQLSADLDSAYGPVCGHRTVHVQEDDGQNGRPQRHVLQYGQV